MKSSRLISRTAVAMLAAGLLAAACEDEGPVEIEPDVATLRLLVGATPDTITVDVATGAFSDTIVIAANTNFAAEFLMPNGQPDTVVNDVEFQLNVTPANAGVVTFTRASAFAGTLNKVAVGTTPVTFALFHLAEAHNEFDRPVPVKVN